MSTSKREPTMDDDSAWDGLAHGDLSADEEAVLRALADESETAAVHYEAYAPLDASFLARTAAELDKRLQAERRTRSRRYIGGAVSAVLAAAAAFAVINLPTESKLGRYTLDVRAGAATVRGAVTASDLVDYHEHSRLLLLARPQEQVEGKVVASLTALIDGRAQPVPTRVEVAKSGAVRVEVEGKDLPAKEGSSLSLLLVVDREPHSDAELLELHRENDPRVLVTRLRRVSSRIEE